MLKNIENQFDTTRHTEFLINPKEIIAYCVFSDPELPCNLAVRHSLSHQIGNFVLSLRKQVSSSRADHSERGRAHEGFENKMEVVAVNPDLSFMYGLNAFAKDTNGFIPTNHTLG